METPEEQKIKDEHISLSEIAPKSGTSSKFRFIVFEYWRRYADEFGLKPYQKVGEMKDLISKFKEFYFKRKMETSGTLSAFKLIDEFQTSIAPIRFCPYQSQYFSWRKKWDREIDEKLRANDADIKLRKEMRNAIILHNEAGNVIPTEAALEDGSKTLAGALVNDAVKMLQDDTELEEIYTADEVIKRRNYVLNVMAHVTKLVQGKQALAIKANAEKRETAGFLIDILRRATSGKMAPEELSLLKSSMNPNQD